MNNLWHKFASREGVDITTISAILPVFCELVEDVSVNKEGDFFTHYKDKIFTHYVNVDPQVVGRVAYKKYFNSIEQIEKYYEDGLVLKDEIALETQKLKSNFESGFSLVEIEQAYGVFLEQFSIVNRIYSIISFFGIEVWQVDFEKMLGAMIERNGLEDERDKIAFSVYQPWKKTALLEIQEKLDSGESVEKLLKEYEFLRGWSIIWYRKLTSDWMDSFEHKSLSEADFESYDIDILLAKLKPEGDEERFLKLAPYIVFFKDWRDDLRRYMVFSWSFLFESIAKYFEVPVFDLGYLSLEEIQSFVKSGEIDFDLIEKRKNGEIVVTMVGKPVSSILMPVPDFYKEVISSCFEIVHDEIKGRVAQKGKVRGRVKILRTYHDVKHVRDGDILVANTTHPNFLPAMKRAAAFVTNEGGMISHAAIVAREMGTPCIVGTGNATDVLQDGDMVEVDAEKGTVRKV